jgi:quinol monooxygenase YgiN
MPSHRAIAYVTCAVALRFSPDVRDRAVHLLLSAVGRTQAKPGCQSCTVARELSEENGVRYTEEWDSQMALERHLASEEFRCVLVAMDMCREEPQVVVGNFSGHNGMEYLRELREKTSPSGI